MDLSWTHAVAALLALVAPPVALLVARRPGAPVASAEARPGEAFALRTTAPGPLRLWLRYDLAYGPDEDAWGLDGRVEVRVGGALAWVDAVRLREGAEATSRPRRFGEEGSWYGVSSWSGPTSTGTTAATVFLGAVEAREGASVEVTGALTPAAGSTARALTVYLSR